MSTFLDTVVEYEDQFIDFVKSLKDPVVDTVAKGVELIEDRLPTPTYPSALPTPFEVVDTQAAFTKKLIDANTALGTAVLETVAPVAGYASSKKDVKAAKAA
jgi:hypothetical protein